MKLLNDHLMHLTTSDARSALYYLSRYLKQAAFFKSYRKDVFEDDLRSVPSEAVRSATLAMISSIEQFEGTPALKFDDATYSKWMAAVRGIENGLDPDPTEAALQRAREFVNSIEIPSPKT